LQVGRQRVAPSHVLRLQLGQHSDGVVPSPRAAEPAPAKAGDGRPGDACGSPALLLNGRRGSGPGVRRRSWLSRQSACAARVHSQSLCHETPIASGNGCGAVQARFLRRQLSLPVSTMSQ
jgi:hypothetical protein